MTAPNAPDPRYIAARRVLLDALEALAPHGPAFILVGAQAVYLRTGESDLAIAPYTTDGDLALDPRLLGDEPTIATAMHNAGFTLDAPPGTQPQPGIWRTTVTIAGETFIVPVDLIVPEAASSGQGNRGARLGPHGNRAARRAVGLEAALIDHDHLLITALDPDDPRALSAEVAGVTALLVAKLHKINDRVTSGRPDRQSDKDAADIYRIMQTASLTTVTATLEQLREHPLTANVTNQALHHLADLFGRRASPGVQMAQRALRLAIDDTQIATLCVTFTRSIGA